MNRAGISQAMLGKFTRYVLIGGASVVMYLALFEVMRRFAGLGVTTSVVAAYVPTLVATFLAQSRLTFASRDLRLRTILKYLMSMAMALGVVLATVWFMIGVVGSSELVANLVACVVSPTVGFALQNFWVFRAARADPP